MITRESLRRYHGLDLEVKSAAKGAKGAFKCPFNWHVRARVRVLTPIFHTRCNCFYSSAIQSTAQSGYIGGQNGGAMCVVPAKDRGANMEHEPLAFECWFCAVLRYQRANSRGSTVLSLASSAASMFVSSLGPLRIVRCIVLLRRVAHSFTVCALLQQLRCCSLHSSCYTSCFDLINSGEQCS